VNALHSEHNQASEHELLGFFVELINSGDLVAVLRPDGQLGWMPAPMPAADDIRICQLCGGSGFLSPAIASIVTPDFRLQNMCPTCNGTGINEEVNERTPTQPYGESFDPDKTSGVQF
jgi:hypothetical protein